MPELSSTRAQRWLLCGWVFALVLALFPFTSDPAAPVKELITAVVAVALGALAVWRVYVARKPLGLSAPAPVLVLVLLAWFSITAFFSAQPAQSLFGLYRWVPLYLVCVHTAQLHTDSRKAGRLGAAIVAACGLSSLYGFLQYSGLDFFPWAATDMEEYRALPSTYGNPNFAGHALVLAIILAAGLLFQRRYWWCVIPLAAMIGHLYLTHMRGGPLAIAAAAFLCLAAWGVSRLDMRHKSLLVAGIVVLAGVGGAGVVAGVQYLRGGGPVEVDSSIALRLNGYAGAARMIMERPAAGFGLARYAAETPAYWTAFEQAWHARTGQRNPHVHNEFLEMAVEGGLVAGLLYIGLLCYAVLAGLQLYFSAPEAETRRLGLTLAACFAGFAVDGCFGFNVHVPVSAGLFFVLLGVLEGLRVGRPGKSGGGLATAVCLLLLGSTALVQTARYFAAEVHFQRAEGALRYLAGAGALPEESRGRVLEGGVAQLESARGLMPWEPGYIEALGGFALAQRQFERAILYFETALAASPDDPGLMLEAAQAHVNLALATSVSATEGTAIQGHIAVAEDHARRALQLCPPLAEAEETLGRCAMVRATLATEGEVAVRAAWGEAASHFEEALRRGAASPGAVLTLLGQARLNAGDLAAAGRALRQAARVAPSDMQVWTTFDRFLEQGGERGELTGALREGLALLLRQPSAPEAVVAEVQGRLGQHYLDEGKVAIAAGLFEAAVGHAPARLDLWGGFAAAQSEANRSGALEALRETLDPQAVPEVLRDIAGSAASPTVFVSRAQGLAGAAQTLAKSDKPAEVNAKLGWIADQLRREMDSIALSEQERGQSLVCIGAVYVEGGRHSEGDALLAEAVDRLPREEQGIALVLRSRAQQALGQGESALALARAAVERSPRRLLIRWHLAKSLAAAGLDAEANLEYLGLLSQAAPNSAEYGELQQEQQRLQARIEAARQGAQP